MNWREQIETRDDVLAGKPVIKNTRLAVNFLLELLAQGWTKEDLMRSYPQLTDEGLRAVFAFAAETVTEEMFFQIPEAAESSS